MKEEAVAPGAGQGWDHYNDPVLEETIWTFPSATGPLMRKAGITAWVLDNIHLRRKKVLVIEKDLAFRM